MQEPREYKNSPAVLVVVVVLFLLLVGGISLTALLDGGSYMIPVVLFAVIIFGGVFIALSSSISISEEEISTRTILGARTLRWTEISRVSGSGYNIKLHNYDGDVTVSPNPGLQGYEQVVDFIGRKRPDLFSPQDYSEIRRGLAPFLLLIFVALLFLGGGLVLFFVFLNSPGTSSASLMPLLVFLVLMVAAVIMSFTIPRSLLLEGDNLRLKYMLSEKTVRAGEIQSIQLGYTQSRNGKHYYIALHLVNGRSMRFAGLGVSLPIAYLVLKNWHQGNMGGQSANHQQIAPNRSDHTWR